MLVCCSHELFAPIQFNSIYGEYFMWIRCVDFELHYSLIEVYFLLLSCVNCSLLFQMFSNCFFKFFLELVFFQVLFFHDTVYQKHNMVEYACLFKLQLWTQNVLNIFKAPFFQLLIFLLSYSLWNKPYMYDFFFVSSCSSFRSLEFGLF